MEVWKKRVRRVCVGVLLLALVLRVSGSSPQTSPASVPVGSDSLTSFLLYLQTGRAVKPTEPETAPHTDPVPASSPPAEEPTEEATVPEATTVFSFPTAPADPGPMRFSAGDKELLEVKYGGDYRPDLGALLEQKVNLDFSGEAPRVLILHTHATEAYTPESGWEYTPSGNYRTLDTGYNMVRVGDEITRVLEEAGIPVLHDETLNDYPSYNGSYNKALTRIEQYLAEYPSIQMVIDVHRDAVEYEDGGQMATAATVGGQRSAQVMLVMGTDEGGLSHPGWQDNLAFALKLQVQLERDYPGLARPLSLRTERFNQHATKGSMLVEVGTAGNTLSEALTAAHCFAETLAELIAGLGLR